LKTFFFFFKEKTYCVLNTKKKILKGKNGRNPSLSKKISKLGPSIRLA